GRSQGVGIIFPAFVFARLGGSAYHPARIAAARDQGRSRPGPGPVLGRPTPSARSGLCGLLNKSSTTLRQPNERQTMKNGKLAGKIAVVTGASKGIGTDIAKQFAAEGAAVVVNYASSKEGADRVVDEIAKRGGKAIAVYANVAKKAEIERLFSAAKTAFGKIDILVNAINPGMVETEGIRAAGFDQGDLRKSIEAQTPLGRIGQPEDIAPVAVFLASSDSGWITGETLRVAGGLR